MVLSGQRPRLVPYAGAETSRGKLLKWSAEDIEYFARCRESGLSYRQIAKEAGVSKSAVSNLLWRAARADGPA